jgi:hypothetical protein
MGADELLVKPMHTRILLQQIEDLIASHERKLAKLGLPTGMEKKAPPVSSKKAPAKKAIAKKAIIRKSVAKKAAAKAVAKKATTKKPVVKKAAKKTAKTSRKPQPTPARRRAKT